MAPALLRHSTGMSTQPRSSFNGPVAPRPEGGRRALAVLDDQVTGVSYVRFHQPFEHLRDRGFELRTLSRTLTLTRTPRGYEPEAGILDGISMLLFPQMIAAPLLPDGSRLLLVEPLCEAARSRGIPVVYSVDDHLEEIETLNPSYEVIAGARPNLEALLHGADAFIVTTPTLEATLAPRERPVHVLPNAVDPSRWTPRPRGSGELRIGWAGSSCHIDDLLMVLPAIRELQRRVDFVFVLLGLTSRPLPVETREIRRNRRGFTPSQKARAEAFLELASLCRSIRHRHVVFGELGAYFSTLPSLDLDVGICPLLDTPFNRHKSALKFYEYAAAGTMTIASEVVPYLGEVSVTTPNEPAAWSDALERFLRDGGARDAELADQREFVFRERNIERLKDRWAAALLEIVSPIS